MFINEESLKFTDLTDITLPSATLCNIDGLESPTLGLLGSIKDENQIILVENKMLQVNKSSEDTNNIKFMKSQLKEGGYRFQSQYHLLLPNIRFWYQINKHYY